MDSLVFRQRLESKRSVNPTEAEVAGTGRSNLGSVTARWSTTLSSKVNLTHAIYCRVLRYTNLVKLRT